MSKYGVTRDRASRTATTGLVVAHLSLVLLVIGYISVSSALMALDAGFRIFLAGIALGLIALAVSLIGLLRTRHMPGRNRAWGGVIISLIILVPMAPHIKAAFSVPGIHDITTDTDNPPAFVDILPLRADAPNGSDYGGETVAAAQKAAYPGLAPLKLSVAPAEAFARAQNLVEARGWVLVTANPDDGRIEATTESKFMHFKDDMVIRITADGEGSRIDMRSVSRFGKSDLGVNAQRITGFLKDLSAS